MRSRVVWISLSGVLALAGALLAGGALGSFPAAFWQSVFQLWDALGGPLLLAPVLPLVSLGLIFLVLLGVDLGPYRTTSGELEQLLARKHEGVLLYRSRRIRESAARMRHFSPNARVSAAVGL